MRGSQDCLPTGLWLEGQLRAIEARGGSYYVIQRGESQSGLVCLKIRRGADIFLYQQERNIDGVLGWQALGPKNAPELKVEEDWSDGYISRASARDPDLWVVEIETRDPEFPLEGPVF